MKNKMRENHFNFLNFFINMQIIQIKYIFKSKWALKWYKLIELSKNSMFKTFLDCLINILYILVLLKNFS